MNDDLRHVLDPFRPLGRMLLSFLNKDPISAAQQSGNTNNNFAESGMHMVSSTANSQTKLDQIPARHCILPVLNKMQPRVTLIEQMSSRTLTAKEKELLADIHQLFRPDATYSPMLTADHLKLLSQFTSTMKHLRSVLCSSFADDQRHSG